MSTQKILRINKGNTIDSDEAYDSALIEFRKVFQAPKGSDDYNKAHILADKIEAYESEQFDLEELSEK
jgi:antitoxin component HigA of HigAB toxin-antitoxin module